MATHTRWRSPGHPLPKSIAVTLRAADARTPLTTTWDLGVDLEVVHRIPFRGGLIGEPGGLILDATLATEFARALLSMAHELELAEATVPPDAGMHCRDCEQGWVPGDVADTFGRCARCLPNAVRSALLGCAGGVHQASPGSGDHRFRHCVTCLKPLPDSYEQGHEASTNFHERNDSYVRACTRARREIEPKLREVADDHTESSAALSEQQQQALDDVRLVLESLPQADRSAVVEQQLMQLWMPRKPPGLDEERERIQAWTRALNAELGQLVN